MAGTDKLSVCIIHLVCGLSCKRSAGRWSRHLTLNETIHRALASVGFPSRLEPTGVSRDDGKRPDGMTLFPWKKGRLLVWYATCTDNMASSYLTRTTAVPGSAAATAELKKKRKYQTLQQRYTVLSLAFETLGHWRPEATRFVSELGSLITRKSF